MSVSCVPLRLPRKGRVANGQYTAKCQINYLHCPDQKLSGRAALLITRCSEGTILREPSMTRSSHIIGPSMRMV